MTSVLECSSDLSCIQGELKVGSTISSFSFRVVLKPSKGSSYIYYFLIFSQSLTWKKVRKRVYYETLTFKSLNVTFRYVRPDEIEAVELSSIQFLPVVLFILPWFDFWVRVGNCLKWDNSNESYWAMHSLWCCMFCCTYKVLLAFKSVDEIVKCGQTGESYRAIL